MSCYFRHIKDIMEEVGIEVRPGNRKEIDRILHRIVGVQYKDCPAAWKKIKEMVKGEPSRREAFVQKLKTAVKG